MNDKTYAWSLKLPSPFYPGLPMYGIIRKGKTMIPFQKMTAKQEDIVQSVIPRITIFAGGCLGYRYQNGNQTPAVASFNLVDISEPYLYPQNDQQFWVNCSYELT
jgi:hypothetical protein